MSAEPDVEISESAAELAEQTARRALQLLAAAVRERGVAHLVLTGGSILEKVLSALAQPDALQWQNVHVWWGDERFVPADSDDRNDVPAARLLLDRVPVDRDKVHRMPAADQIDTAEAAADSYAGELAGAAPQGAPVPEFDLALLGVGPDGHCASLFPHHPATTVRDRSVIAVHNSPKPPPDRLSLSFPALDAAREIWFVVSGEPKADAVAKVLAGAPKEEVPSAGPRGRERTTWLIDRSAASKLSD